MKNSSESKQQKSQKRIYAESIELQKKMATQVIAQDQFSPIKTVAGTDVGFNKACNIGRGVISVHSFPDLKLIDHAIIDEPITFPYIPGLLSFREVPLLIKAYKKLRIKPDLYLCDGQGIAHPRRFGIACHLGILFDKPAIGVAKSRLIGSHSQLGKEKGRWVKLMDKDEIIGGVLRSRTGVKPLYISLGHRISLTSSIDYVIQCLTRYRLPETTRTAHKFSTFNKNVSQ